MRGWGHEQRRPGKYPDAVRTPGGEVGVGSRDEYESEWAAITSIAEKSGMTAETLRKWVRQTETDLGSPSRGDQRGVGADASLERENRELRRANEILKAAAAFFGAELDRQPRR